MQPILVTGAAGFIGYHLSNKLISLGYRVFGLDNLNEYYDPQLKEDRLKNIMDDTNFSFVKMGLEEQERLKDLFNNYKFKIVINLAAQAGVRYSLINPNAYIKSNIVGFLNILECCKDYEVEHLIYASSSSVYGANQNIPFSVHHPVNHPVSLYAATKKSNELMAHTYSHLYSIPTTGLRFFTVYGPWGRPDMAYYSFTKSILSGKPIKIFNYGKMKRDFTYIDDIVDGIIKITESSPPTYNPNYDRISLDPGSSYAPYRLYNLGNNKPVELIDFISVLERELGVEAKKELLPMQPGDVEVTYADIQDSMVDLAFRPNTSIEQGLKKFVEWYKNYYRSNMY